MTASSRVPSPVAVRLLPPQCGAAPLVPADADVFLQRIDTLRFEPPTVGEALRDDLLALPRALFGRRYHGRQRGLTRFQTRRWCREVAPHLSAAERAAFADYAEACRRWCREMRRSTERGERAWDWRMTSARNVQPNAAEQQLEQALVTAGLPVDGQVGVSRHREGGRRRGGWYGNWWLDYAHRDRAYLLKIDIELDGWHHRQPDRAQRDAVRNECLQGRGWYVCRVPGMVISRQQQDQAILPLLECVRTHRLAVLTARSHVRLIRRLLR